MIRGDFEAMRSVVSAAAVAVRPEAAPVPIGCLLADLGIDSLDRLVLIDRIEQTTGVTVPDSIAADAATLDDLATYLAASNVSADPLTIQTSARPTLTDLGIIDAGARIGEGTRLWHHAQIASGAHVGEDCTLGKGAYVGSGSDIGDRVKIGNYACVFGAEVADEAMISPHAALLEDPAPRATNPDGSRKQHADYQRRPVTVGRRASIGASATIAPGVTIGHDALVAVGAVVVRDVPPHALVAGNPARQCGWVCTCGYTLTADLRCSDCRRAYTRSGDALSPVDADE